MKLIKLFLLLFFSLSIQAQYCFNFGDWADDFINDNISDEFKLLMKDDALGADYMSTWNYLKRGGFDFDTRTNPELLRQLQTDVANTKYNLQEIFENDPDEILIWKELKDNPFNASEIIKETTDVRWLKWKDREFAKAIFGKGNKFNDHMAPRIFTDLTAEGVDLKNTIQIDELYILPKKSADIYGKKVILDNAFIKEVTNDFGDLEYYKIIYNDNKFGPNSPWTPNQKEEIIHFFRDNLDEYITLKIRSTNTTLLSKGIDTEIINYGMEVRLYREDIYKTLNNGNDLTPEFGEIINMNSKKFKE